MCLRLAFPPASISECDDQDARFPLWQSLTGNFRICWTPTCSSAESMWDKEREKNQGKERQCRGIKWQTVCVCVCLSTCASAGEEEESGREIRESLKWDSTDRSAQIDIAITKKAIPQLGIHLHTLKPGCSPATVSLRLAQQRLIHKQSTQKGHHWAVTAHTLTMKIPSCLLWCVEPEEEVYIPAKWEKLTQTPTKETRSQSLQLHAMKKDWRTRRQRRISFPSLVWRLQCLLEFPH